MKMTSAQDVEMSVTTNSPSQDSFHTGDRIPSKYETPWFKPFSNRRRESYCTVTPYFTKRLLIVPKSPTTTYGDRAFSIAAPKLWNNLPDSEKYAETVKQFKSLDKTYLFKEAFD